MAKQWCLALFVALVVATEAKAPCTCGSVLRIKKHAMEYAAQTQRRPLQESLQLLSIPGFKRETQSGGGFLSGLKPWNPLGIIGGVENIGNTILKILGIDIKKVQLPEMKVTLRPGVGVKVDINTAIDVKLRAILIGGVEIRVGTGATADLVITKTSKGHPILTIKACKSIEGDFNVIVGKTELIPDVLKLIRNHIHAFLAEKMCLIVSSTFLKLNVRLETFGDSVHTDEQVGLQYTMPSPPVVTEQYMDMGMSVGYQVKEENYEHLTMISKTLELPPDAGSSEAMVNMGFSVDYFSNFFGALYSTGMFSMEVSSQTVSTADARFLSTDNLGFMIPQIKNMFPKNEPIKMLITLSRAPVLSLEPGKIILRLTPAMEILTAIPGTQPKSLLVLNLDLLLSASMDISGGKLMLSLAMEKDIQLTVATSNVGPCQASNLQGYISSYFDHVFMANVNLQLKKGMDLPSLPNVDLINPVAEIQKEYAVVSCDLQYHE
ncbi:BPI fold-containing family B member 2-like [Lissotriton helveticus]